MDVLVIHRKGGLMQQRFVGEVALVTAGGAGGGDLTYLPGMCNGKQRL
jgi:hypothetical protein